MAPNQAVPQKPYTILAALALDETGDWALHEAISLAHGRPNCDVHIVYVVAEQGPTESSSELVSLERRLAHAPQAVRERLEALEYELPVKITVHLRVGVPAKSILQTAADLAADVIVVGTHRRRGIENWILGSVATDVVRTAHCPVMIALPKDYGGIAKSASIEPPCPDCMAARAASGNKEFWCERHSRKYQQPHVYEPGGPTRDTLMPST